MQSEGVISGLRVHLDSDSVHLSRSRRVTCPVSSSSEVQAEIRRARKKDWRGGVSCKSGYSESANRRTCS